jgi:hypothetical protein
MKLSITVWLFAAGVVACSHDSRPHTAAVTTEPPAPTRVETAQVSESAPPESGIPTNGPTVAPPVPVVTPPPDTTPLSLTPASGVGSPRSGSAPLVATPPAADGAHDKADTAQDRASIREIRQLLASDSTISAIAPQLTIVARSGRVWLRGQVSTSEQRAAIEKAARRAGGVLNVNNELAVME